MFTALAWVPSCPAVVDPVTLVLGMRATLGVSGLPLSSLHLSGEAHFVPPKAKIMNRTVPTYSPIMAMKSATVSICAS